VRPLFQGGNSSSANHPDDRTPKTLAALAMMRDCTSILRTCQRLLATFDRAFLEMCSEVWVLTLDGWRESEGVQAEMAMARELGKPVVVVEPEALNDRTPARAGVVEVKGAKNAIP